jgi:hypothetical protein
MKQQLKHDSVNDTVILCCGSKRCPQLKIVDDVVKITDDYGQTISISREQAGLIPQAIDIVDQNKQDK